MPHLAHQNVENETKRNEVREINAQNHNTDRTNNENALEID
jgi:hypothetical protein